MATPFPGNCVSSCFESFTKQQAKSPSAKRKKKSLCQFEKYLLSLLEKHSDTMFGAVFVLLVAVFVCSGEAGPPVKPAAREGLSSVADFCSGRGSLDTAEDLFSSAFARKNRKIWTGSEACYMCLQSKIQKNGSVSFSLLVGGMSKYKNGSVLAGSQCFFKFGFVSLYSTRLCMQRQ